MAWWGAGIGGTIGLLFGGPIGAIIGAGIGSSLTKDSAQGEHLGSGQKRQIGFLVAAFSMLGKIAKADGIVSDDEIAFVDSFIKRQLELDPKSRQVAIEIFNRAKHDNTSIYKYAQQFTEIFVLDDAMRETIYRVLFMTALADGQLHPAEQEILEQLPLYLQLEGDAYARMSAELGGHSGGGSGGTAQGFSENLDTYYKILGVEKSATDVEVKSAFRKKAQEYHPDKLASKGLPEGFTRFAKEQMQQFTEAHDKIMQSRRRNA
ncbi:MAG: co-chaperone DjlA [Nitrospiria bacterium]